MQKLTREERETVILTSEAGDVYDKQGFVPAIENRQLLWRHTDILGMS